MMHENFPASADVLLDKTRELLTIDELNVDLLSISNLFLLNNFVNLNLTQFTCNYSLMGIQNDPKLTQNDEFFKSINEIVEKSPCKNLTKHPTCKNYCDMHEQIVSTFKLKKYFLELMR